MVIKDAATLQDAVCDIANGKAPLPIEELDTRYRVPLAAWVAVKARGLPAARRGSSLWLLAGWMDRVASGDIRIPREDLDTKSPVPIAGWLSRKFHVASLPPALRSPLLPPAHVEVDMFGSPRCGFYDDPEDWGLPFDVGCQ